MEKQAFLIMAHENFDQLALLLRLLDSPRAEFFLHVDQKATLPQDFAARCKLSAPLHFIPRRKVNWGGYSQIACELDLIEAALKTGHYSHLHLLSGADLPLRPAEEILDFFDANRDREFLLFDAPALQEEFFERFTVYHFFQERERSSTFFNKLEWHLVQWQKKIGVSRVKKSAAPFAKGANWFSLTENFCAWAMERKKWIRKTFSHSRCCDEIFLQTLLLSSPYRENLYLPTFEDDYRSICRCVDWNRGLPYTFRKEDLPELFRSGYLFARKFSVNVDREAVLGVWRHLKNTEFSL